MPANYKSRIKPTVPVWHPSPHRHDKPGYRLKLDVDMRTTSRSAAVRAFTALFMEMYDGFRQAQTAEILRLYAQAKPRLGESAIARLVGVEVGRVHAEIFKTRPALVKLSNAKHST